MRLYVWGHLISLLATEWRLERSSRCLMHVVAWDDKVVGKGGLCRESS